MKKSFIATIFLFIGNSCILLGQELIKARICYYKKDGTLSSNCSSVKAFPFYFNDTTPDEILLRAYDKYKAFKMFGKPYFVIYQNDTNKFAAVVGKQIISKFWENGNIRSFSVFKNYKLNGRYIEYHEVGGVKIKGMYRKGNETGKWKYFNEEWEKIKIEKYKNGELKKSKNIVNPHKALLPLFKIKRPEGRPSKIELI